MSDSVIVVEDNGEIVVIEPTVVINQGGNSAWGEIGGDIGNQSDLIAEFAKKMNIEPTVIPPETDINLVVEKGVYLINNGTAVMSVYATTEFVMQIWYNDDNSIFIRKKYPISEWSEFETLANESQLSTKQDKEYGKGLSTNDYTTEEKNKLAGIEAGAQVNVIPTWNSVTDKPETFPPAAHTHSGMVTSSTVAEIVTLTQTAYDALNPKVATTLYIIAGA